CRPPTPSFSAHWPNSRLISTRFPASANWKEPEMDWEEIRTGVSGVYAAIRKMQCPNCKEASFVPNSQFLAYYVIEQTMADFMEIQCVKCGHKKTCVFPQRHLDEVKKFVAESEQPVSPLEQRRLRVV